jgi:hypothetical protein
MSAVAPPIVSGCFAGSSSRPPSTHAPPKGTLAITVALRRCTDKMGLCIGRPPLHYTLTCGPAGGSMPQAAAACAAIADLRRPRADTGRGCVMRGVVVNAATASIHGTFAGAPFALGLTSAGSWCGRPRSVTRDYWILSTFPCSTIVIHEARAEPYAGWARASGCGE